VKALLLIVIATCGLACGCSEPVRQAKAGVDLKPTVTAVPPEVRTIQHSVGQPGVIEPYEQTAIYSKIAGFVQKWYVDIGAHVKKDQLMAELLVPELEEEHKQKVALVEHEQSVVKQTDQLVHVAESNLQAAADAVTETQENVGRYEADVQRWTGELSRLKEMVKDRVVNPEVLAETENQAKASTAALAAAKAAVKTKESQRLAAESQVEKAKADLEAAISEVKVAEAEERRLAAMFAYTKITAPYDGVVTTRNVNTGDFVRPASGDASGNMDGSGTQSSPLFVVALTNPMMFVIGVPEVDAAYVSTGSKASISLQALAGREFDLPVARTSLALRNQSRTLEAEIDLPNPNDELLPGMYAYGEIEIERDKVWAVPSSSIVQIGNRMCCYLVHNGEATRFQIQAGVSDGQWTEVAKKRSYPTAGAPGAWEDFNGSEQVIDGDLAEITAGKQIKVEPAQPSQLRPLAVSATGH
jgi:HlyD family secretion protein